MKRLISIRAYGRIFRPEEMTGERYVGIIGNPVRFELHPRAGDRLSPTFFNHCGLCLKRHRMWIAADADWRRLPKLLCISSHFGKGRVFIKPRRMRLCTRCWRQLTK